MDWVTTSTILQGLRDFGNDAAWGRLVERFRAPIEAFGVGLGLRPGEAEDLTQTVLGELARAFREGRYDRSRGRLSSYLFGIAHRQALKMLRERPDGGEDAASRVSEETAASVMWEEHWEHAVIRQCLERVRAEVDPRAFAAFELVVQRSVTAAAAAAELGEPVKFVYNAKHRVLTRLRELRAEMEELDDGAGPVLS